MEERREARTGTVSGLALLVGGTAVAAVAGGAHSIFATILLGLLTLGLGHSLAVEIKRQAGRRAGGWSRHDSINTVLLGLWSEGAMIMTILWPGSPTLRAVGLMLSLAYAVGCGYFVNQRRRAIAAAGLRPAEAPTVAAGSPAAEAPTPPAALAAAGSPAAEAAIPPPAEPQPAEPPFAPGAPSLAEAAVPRGAAPVS